MRTTHKFILLLSIMAAFVSCESSSNYSKQLESEQKKINAWFARQQKTVLTECPKDSDFVIGQWYHIEENGIYFCIDSIGNTSNRIKDGDELNVRYRYSTLDENAMVYNYWTTLDSNSPTMLVKGSTTNSCTGWDYAFDVMRFSGTTAQVIVPSKLGFSDATTSVTPYYYQLRVHKIAK